MGNQLFILLISHFLTFSLPHLLTFSLSHLLIKNRRHLWHQIVEITSA